MEYLWCCETLLVTTVAKTRTTAAHTTCSKCHSIRSRVGGSKSRVKGFGFLDTVQITKRDLNYKYPLETGGPRLMDSVPVLRDLRVTKHYKTSRRIYIIHIMKHSHQAVDFIMNQLTDDITPC